MADCVEVEIYGAVTRGTTEWILGGQDPSRGAWKMPALHCVLPASLIEVVRNGDGNESFVGRVVTVAWN